MVSIRVTIFVVGLLGGLLVSPWIPAIAILVLSLRFRAYEALLLALLIDLFWLPAGHVPLFTIGAIIIVWFLEPIRNEFLL